MSINEFYMVKQEESRLMNRYMPVREICYLSNQRFGLARKMRTVTLSRPTIKIESLDSKNIVINQLINKTSVRYRHKRSVDNYDSIKENLLHEAYYLFPDYIVSIEIKFYE